MVGRLRLNLELYYGINLMDVYSTVDTTSTERANKVPFNTEPDCCTL